MLQESPKVDLPSGLQLARDCSLLCNGVSVLYVSGCRLNEELQTDLRSPKRGFLAKPFRGNDLLRKARELLLFEPAGQVSLSS
jgi:hypothetical protein